jgi:cytoskeletal protein CcmA (bactofilin family)
MLKRPKRTEKDKAAAAVGVSEEERKMLDSGSVSEAESTVIGEHITVEGKISGAEHLVIEGTLIGAVELKNHNFGIGSKGRFEGDIEAQNVSMSGEVKGNITALGQVKITKEADFFGEIRANTISVEDGAYFKGLIELQRKPNRKIVKAAPPDSIKAQHSPKETESLSEKAAGKGT